MPDALSLPFLQLTYRPDLGVLFMRWQRQTTSVELRQAYASALQMAEQHQTGRWLIDLRRRGLADPTDFAWIVRDVREDLGKRVATPGRRIAYLVTPTLAPGILGRLISLESSIPDTSRAAADFRIFTEEQAAVAWLQEPVQ